MPTISISPETNKLIDLASKVLATNEAGNKPYQLSHARLGNSGYSFGWNQFDIANNPTGLNIFIDILKNARTSNGQSILDSNWINSKKDIWGVTQNPNADRGTSKLKSLCSMEYRYRLQKKISHIYHI